MRLKTCFAALVILLSVSGYPQVFAQQKAKTPRILILLDGSSSMNEDWNNGRSRFSEAGRFILALIDSMSEANESVEFGLRVFGHQYPAQQKNCYDTKREVPFFPGNRTQMQSRLESLHGYGVSPIAYALSEAATEDFGNEDKYAYSIVLVTDGGESCDGDICKVVQELLQRKIFFRPYIVSLSDYASLRDLYACLGTFLTVTKESEVPVGVHKIVDAHREGFERAKTGTTRPVLYRDSIPPVVKAPEKPKDTLAVKIVEKTPERDRRVIRHIPINQRLKVFMEITVDILEPVKIDVPPFVWSKRDPVPADPAPVVVVKTPEPVLRKAEKQLVRLRSAPRKSYPSLFTIPTPKKQEVPPFVLSKLPDPLPVVVAPAPVRKAEKPFAGLKPAGRKILSSKAPAAVPAPKKLVVPAFVYSKQAPVATPKPDGDALIRVTHAYNHDSVELVPVSDLEKRVKTDRPLIKKTTPPVAAANPKSTPFTVEKDPAAETLLEVYFTDGHGKFYSSNPQILLTDPASGKVTQKFYRTVDPNGNPDQQKIPAGTYNLSVAGSDRTFLRNVVINPNANNKVIITVTSGSLQFSYTGRNAKKPVDKYFAIVKRNFEPLPVVKQDCDTQLFYPPGNYHIEVNTLPPTIYSVDLSFGVTVMLPVAEAGTVIFSNMANLGKIRLYYPLGDKFVQFHTMNITGDPARQVVELKPGMYQVYYSLAPGMPERVLTFPIRSNETTTIELK